jgi:hypothetical protein
LGEVGWERGSIWEGGDNEEDREWKGEKRKRGTGGGGREKRGMGERERKKESYWVFTTKGLESQAIAQGL